MLRHLFTLSTVLYSATLLGDISMSDRYDNFQRSESIVDFLRNDISEEETKIAKKVFSVLDTAEKMWKIEGRPSITNNYYEIAFIPKNQDSLIPEFFSFTSHHNDPSETIHTEWERIKKLTPKYALNIEILSNEARSIVYAINGSREIPTRNVNRTDKCYYNELGIITEFDNHIIWSLNYINRNPLTQTEREAMNKKLQSLQESLLNE